MESLFVVLFLLICQVTLGSESDESWSFEEASLGWSSEEDGTPRGDNSRIYGGTEALPSKN